MPFFFYIVSIAYSILLLTSATIASITTSIVLIAYVLIACVSTAYISTTIGLAFASSSIAISLYSRASLIVTRLYLAGLAALSTSSILAEGSAILVKSSISIS